MKVRTRLIHGQAYSTKVWLPKTDEDGYSDYLLCYDSEANKAAPFVAWYNSKQQRWEVSHHYANNDPATVLYFMKLPNRKLINQ